MYMNILSRLLNGLTTKDVAFARAIAKHSDKDNSNYNDYQKAKVTYNIAKAFMQYNIKGMFNEKYDEVIDNMFIALTIYDRAVFLLEELKNIYEYNAYSKFMKCNNEEGLEYIKTILLLS